MAASPNSVAIEVVPDFRDKAPRPLGDMDLGDQELFRLGEVAKLKELFAGELARDEEQNKQMLSTKFKAERSATRAFLKALDKSLVSGMGFGLQAFCPTHKPRALLDGEKRFIAEVVLGNNGPTVARSAIEDKSGRTWIGCPRSVVAGEVKYPILHLSLDQCSVGWSGAQWLLLTKQLRMPVAMDPLHRLHHDWVNAVCASGLALVRLEFRLLTRMREGPFNGQSNMSVLRGVAEEFFTLHSPDNGLWEILYDDLVQNSPKLAAAPGVGTSEHHRVAWNVAAEEAITRGLGERVELGRWFSFECQSREAHKVRTIDLLLLLYLGMKRGRWSSFQDSPLHTSSESSADQAHWSGHGFGKVGSS